MISQAAFAAALRLADAAGMIHHRTRAGESRCLSVRQQQNVNRPTFAGQAGQRASTAQHFVIWVGRDDYDSLRQGASS